MSANTITEQDAEQPKGLLGMVKRLGNKVPPPALMFGYLILIVIVLSWLLSLFGVSITEDVAVPVTDGVTQYDYFEDTTQPGHDQP